MTEYTIHPTPSDAPTTAVAIVYLITTPVTYRVDDAEPKKDETSIALKVTYISMPDNPNICTLRDIISIESRQKMDHLSHLFVKTVKCPSVYGTVIANHLPQIPEIPTFASFFKDIDLARPLSMNASCPMMVKRDGGICHMP